MVQLKRYERQKAIDYARAWALGRNPVYHDYENVLKENPMDNGRVTRSMEFVKKNYNYLMEHGFKK